MLAHTGTRLHWVVSPISIGAVVIGAYLAWGALSNEGPTIRISFESGEGLQAGQSQLKYKDTVFGTVKRLEPTPDQTRVIATAVMTRQAEPLLTDGTVFWVVKPRLFAGNISGLETLLSGSYIGMLPAAKVGKAQRDFVGREDPPVLGAHVAGRTFLLKSKRVGAVSVGSPIFFRDLNVGEVLGWDIAEMAEYVTIHAFVRAPYDSYVHEDTRFWRNSRLSIKPADTGIENELESLRAPILEGIGFDTVNSKGHPLEAALEGYTFPLFADRGAAQDAAYTRMLPVMSFFHGSVSGLGAGSPVTMHGLVVGHVTDVRFAYDTDKDAVMASVRYDVELEHVVEAGVRGYDTFEEQIHALLQGLRATLQSASPITGQQQVMLDVLPNAPPVQVIIEGEYFVVLTAED
jgi:paraquat-inducible protein B